MEMSGEQLIPAPQKVVWDALNDPEMLKASVPGCESIERTGDNEFLVQMVARVGPVSAKFKGKLTLSDVKPPDSYSIAFEGQGGPAGFAKGGAQVRLSSQGDGTKLAYDVKASVGGKLAQIGSRLIDAAAKKVADDFFRNFNQKVGGAQGGDLSGGDADATVVLPAASEDETVVLAPPPAKKKEHEEHDEHGKPIPRDPDLPDVSNTTLMFFSAGALVIFLVALVVYLQH
jgi:carbon monoxide dehydrogenase subunit G